MLAPLLFSTSVTNPLLPLPSTRQHKRAGTFDKTLSELYDFGRRRQWKLPGATATSPTSQDPRAAGGLGLTNTLQSPPPPHMQPERPPSVQGYYM